MITAGPIPANLRVVAAASTTIVPRAIIRFCRFIRRAARDSPIANGSFERCPSPPLRLSGIASGIVKSGDGKQPTANSQQPTANSPQPTAHKPTSHGPPATARPEFHAVSMWRDFCDSHDEVKRLTRRIVSNIQSASPSSFWL